MFRQWSGIKQASSHYGRRALATTLIHDEGVHLITVQKILGHKSAATTTIYQNVTDEQVENVPINVGNSFVNKGSSMIGTS